MQAEIIFSRQAESRWVTSGESIDHKRYLYLACTMMRLRLQWTALEALAAMVATLAIYAVQATLSLLARGESPIGAMGGAFGYAAMMSIYTIPLMVAVNVPTALTAIWLWTVLANRDIVVDVSRRQLACGAVVGGIAAALVFFTVAALTDVLGPEYVTPLATVTGLATAAGLFLPRVMSLDLEPGVFAPRRPAGLSSRSAPSSALP
ncbi:MAG TPA: hypothetical protein PKE51_12120 [Gemmatimonadaceae bacterium]|nr:hypothetical protein [Gemmatimonadaceae bacterium]